VSWVFFRQPDQQETRVWSHRSDSQLLDLDSIVVESVRRVDDGSQVVRLGTSFRGVGVCPQCGQKTTRSW